MATYTNRSNAPAQRGQSVVVTLNAADAANIGDISIGDDATIGSNSKVGYVDFIDAPGNTFHIAPKTAADRLDSSSTPGILANAETITIV